MLSIAGVIGASLFVGSSVAIAEAGPAVLLAYLFAGLLVVMIMRMLAEMAVATPDTGSFSTYADKAIGPGRVTPSAGCTGGSGCWLSRWRRISPPSFFTPGCLVFYLAVFSGYHAGINRQ
jgi:GABA permease